ncbi:Aminomethyltransferase [Candidatus Entotheonellaceae bacterium PAL068K]
MRRSALFAVQQALGATFTEIASWELPRHFGAPETEYQAVRQAVGLCDVSHRGLVRVTGKDRQRFLHAMVSNDTASLQPGQGCYATFLTHKGRLVADFVVYAEAESYLLDLEPQAVQSLIEALEWFVFSEDVVLQDESAQSGLLSLQGPRAAELLALALGQAAPELPTYAHTRCQLAGQPVRLIRRSHTGELGYQLLAPLAALPDLWQALWQHHEACEARAVGLEALEVLRIEAGIPLFGRDMTAETMPVEANLDEAISYTKGCYIGQEVIARIEGRGHVNRKLVGLLLGDARLPEPGSRVVSPQRDVGWITSATYSPVRQQNIAFGYVRHEVWTPGTCLEVQANGTTIGATVAELPFYRGRLRAVQSFP